MSQKNVITAQSLTLALWLALATRDYPECKDLIQQGVYLDARDEMGRSPLYMTVQSSKLDKFTRMLLNAGAPVNGTTIFGETVIFAAARAGHDKAVKLLLKRLADPNIRNRKGETALMQAAEEGHFDVVKLLADAGADVNATDDNGETSLMMAAAMDCRDVVDVLLAAGADRSMSTRYGWNALTFAEAFENMEISKMLKTDLPEDDWPGPALALASSLEEARVE